MSDNDAAVPDEPCREWINKLGFAPERCNRPSVLIIWGKRFDSEALGPRCYDHAEKWLGRMDAHTIEQSAVFDLRVLAAERRRVRVETLDAAVKAIETQLASVPQPDYGWFCGMSHARTEVAALRDDATEPSR